MAKIEKRSAKKWFKCDCGEQVRTDEKFFQVVENDGKDRKGEKYCVGCEKYAHANNDDIGEANNDDGEQHLRAMEDFAAYKAAGCTDAYWTDRDAGFCN